MHIHSHGSQQFSCFVLTPYHHVCSTFLLVVILTKGGNSGWLALHVCNFNKYILPPLGIEKSHFLLHQENRIPFACSYGFIEKSLAGIVML